MSLQKFLFIYYGISYSATVNMSHKDVDEILNFVSRTSFEHANKNQELVNTGKIVYVYDKSGKYYPYIVPEITYCFEYDEENLSDSLYIDEEKEEGPLDLENCSLYELKQLLIANKNRYGIRRKISKEIKERNGQKSPIKRKEYVYDQY